MAVARTFSWIARAIACLLLACTASTGSAVESAGGTDIKAWADQLVGGGISRGLFPGAVVAVVDETGFVYLKGYGTANLLTKQSADPDKTMVQIGSITKLFTAILALQLVEEKKINLDEDISHYLKRIKLQRPDFGVLTVRDLLTHRAGFDSSLIGTVLDSPDLVDESPRQMSRMFIRVRPAREVSSYDNLAVGLLGILLEDRTGETFARLLQDRIFTPLHMGSTISSYQPVFDDRLAGCAVPDGHGGWEHCAWLYAPERDLPAGGIFTTAADMAKFMRMLLSAGAYESGHLLSSETYRDFVNFDENRLNPGIPGIGLLALQETPISRGDWGHDGGGYGSVNTLYVSPRGHLAGFLGVTGGSKDIPLTLNGLYDYFRIDADRESQMANAYSLLNDFDAGIAAHAPIDTSPVTQPADAAPLLPHVMLERIAGKYFSVRRSNFAPLLGRFIQVLLPWTDVVLNSDDSLTIDGSGPWQQVARGLFLGPAGKHIAFQITDKGVFAGSISHSLLERRSRWSQPEYTIMPFFGAVLISLSALTLAFRPKAPGMKRGAERLIGVGALVLLLTLAAEFQYGAALYVRDQDYLALLFRVPLQLALIALLIGPVFVLLGWRRGEYRSHWGLLYGSLLAVAALASVTLGATLGLVGHLGGV